MKSLKVTLFASMVAASMALTSCGESAPEVKVSAEMTAFMGKLNGRASAVEAAFAEYEAPGLDRKGVDMLTLKEAKAIAADKDCFTMEAKAGMTTRTIVLCWEGGKIKSVEEKAMK